MNRQGLIMKTAAASPAPSSVLDRVSAGQRRLGLLMLPRSDRSASNAGEV